MDSFTFLYLFLPFYLTFATLLQLCFSPNARSIWLWLASAAALFCTTVLMLDFLHIWLQFLPYDYWPFLCPSALALYALSVIFNRPHRYVLDVFALLAAAILTFPAFIILIAPAIT